jgi:hypothetical protein
MNIIFGKHDNCPKEFCWEVPEHFKNEIHKGDLLLVNTFQGLDIAIAVSDVICGDGANYIAEKAGAYFPLKGIVSFANNMMVSYIDNKVKKDIISNIQCSNIVDLECLDMPF